tara:strand:+ start:316 stop:1326 length:1011 start_codon:yes stop_codon:yes gene_type:complete
MMIFKKIVVRFFVLAVMLVAMNFIYILFFLESDLQAHSPIINSLRAIPKETTVLYFGESSNTSYSELDKNKKSISQMLDNLLPNETVSDITKSAAHAGIYKVLMENVSETNNIHTVVVTMNLRSFNADWVYSDLEAPLQKEILLLQKRPALYNRFLLSFKGYHPMNDRKRFEKINAWQGSISLKVTGLPTFNNIESWKQKIKDNWKGDDLEQRQLALNYTNTFGFNINFKKHPRIIDFNEIISISKKRNWNLVFHILPENMETMEALVGNSLPKIVQENSTKLAEYFSQKGVTVVNGVSLNKGEEFSDKAYPTEHYAEKGRMVVAQKIKECFSQRE